MRQQLVNTELRRHSYADGVVSPGGCAVMLVMLLLKAAKVVSKASCGAYYCDVGAVNRMGCFCATQSVAGNVAGISSMLDQGAAPEGVCLFVVVRWKRRHLCSESWACAHCNAIGLGGLEESSTERSSVTGSREPNPRAAQRCQQSDASGEAHLPNGSRS